MSLMKDAMHKTLINELKEMLNRLDKIEKYEDAWNSERYVKETFLTTLELLAELKLAEEPKP